MGHMWIHNHYLHSFALFLSPRWSTVHFIMANLSPSLYIHKSEFFHFCGLSKLLSSSSQHDFVCISHRLAQSIQPFFPLSGGFKRGRKSLQGFPCCFFILPYIPCKARMVQASRLGTTICLWLGQSRFTKGLLLHASFTTFAFPV